MMIIDLVDEDDFRQQLMLLGIELPADADPETCARLAQAQHQQTPVEGLVQLISEWMQQRDLMQPEVRQAIEAYLLAL
ncbi:hypothetical protein [Nitrincola sp. MINF-07-Sa-05]|uniref:hypothetical protein n=1 Tax=Nitrincola salilacus TaxID=3400273 RepID=UPI003917F300